MMRLVSEAALIMGVVIGASSCLKCWFSVSGILVITACIGSYVLIVNFGEKALK